MLVLEVTTLPSNVMSPMTQVIINYNEIITLPFSGIDNNELFLELQNKPNWISITPSFTIQSLIDQMPGQNFETDSSRVKVFPHNILPHPNL